ncbi:hypothetical protein [Crenothrix sp.]|uniref:hypothetical protein n=1 Tax=Crenothrix sp. TaxID=3100433 RepID=UPI00374C8A8A
MISREQLKHDIDSVNEAHIETLHRIILALKQPLSSVTSVTSPKEPNPLKGSVIFEQDLMTPIGDSWNVEQ